MKPKKAPRKKDGRIDWNAYKRRYKKADPVKYYYQYAKNNARARGIKWKLTLEFFRKKFSESGWKPEDIGKARVHLDRINDKGIYTPQNIQFIEGSDHIRKTAIENKLRKNKGYQPYSGDEIPQNIKLPASMRFESTEDADEWPW